MRCGFYESDITPPLGTTIFGYVDRRKSEGVKDKLHTKAAVFESNGTYVALLSVDCLSIPKGMPEIVKERVSEYTPINPDNIMIAATHSHTSGPNFKDLGAYKRGRIFDYEPELDMELDGKTVDFFNLLSADAIILAYQRLEEAEVKFATGKAENVAFVREHYTKTGEIRTNPPKKDAVRAIDEADCELPVFFVTDKAGKPLGLISSFGVHHDTVQGSESSADYSGVVSRKMKEKYGLDFVTVFFSAFCGNTNTYNFYHTEIPERRNYKEVGEVLYEKLTEAIADAQPTADTLGVKKDFIKIKKREISQELIEEVEELVKNPPKDVSVTITDPEVLKYLRATTLLDIYKNDQRKEFDIPVMVVRIGDCLVYSLVGEMFSQFGEKIKSNSPSKNNLLAELAHEPSYGYIPTEELFLPTVYESSPTSAKLEREAGDKMTQKAIEIAKELYK